MEGCFLELKDSLLAKYRKILQKQFFFGLLNKFYESILFKAQPCTISHSHSYMESKPKEDPLVDERVEAALRLAKQARGEPEEVKKPEVKRGVARGRARASRGKTSGGRTPSRAVQLPDFSVRVEYTISEDNMNRYQEIKSRQIGSTFGNSGNIAKLKKQEFAAKKAFLGKLKAKFSPNPQSQIDEFVCQAYAVHKISGEMKMILSDNDIMNSFKSLLTMNDRQFADPENATQLYKAFAVIKWIHEQIEYMRAIDIRNTQQALTDILQLVKTAIDRASPMESYLDFTNEASMVALLQETCTRDEFLSLVRDHKELHCLLLQNETFKFLFKNQGAIQSLQGLKFVHSILNPKQIVAFAG